MATEEVNGTTSNSGGIKGNLRPVINRNEALGETGFTGDIIRQNQLREHHIDWHGEGDVIAIAPSRLTVTLLRGHQCIGPRLESEHADIRRCKAIVREIAPRRIDTVEAIDWAVIRRDGGGDSIRGD